MMLDGLELKGRMMIVALGITTEGVKIPLGLWEGSTENATVATALLSDLVERGLDPEQGMLFVIDGSRRCARPCARRSRSPGPALPLAQGAHRTRPSPRARPPADQGPDAQGMAGDRLPSRARAAHPARRRARAHPPRRRRLAQGRNGGNTDGDPARDQGQAPPHAGVHESVRVDDRHRPHHQRNVKHWSSGEMGLRWTAAGMLEAEQQFRKVIGYTDLPRLAVAIERRLHLPQPNNLTTQEAAITVTL